MMYPILCKVRYESLHRLLSQRSMWKQIIFSICVNWILAPFFMVSNPYHSENKISTATNDDLLIASLPLLGLFSPTRAVCEPA